MPNAIDLALRRIRKQVPREVIDIFFTVKPNSAKRSMSTDQNIIETVIKSMVIPDCNINGGRTIEITLQSSFHEETEATFNDVNTGIGPYSLYRIPPEVRDNCDILEVHHVRPPSPFGGASGVINRVGDLCPPCAVGPSAKAVLDSHTAGDTSRKPIPELLNGNIVRLHPGYFSHIDWVLVCRVAYDDNMTGLNNAALEAFAKLCVLATKAYIYNEGVVKVDAAFIHGGAEFESIKALIDDYGSKQEEYDEVLNKYFAANFLDIKRIAPIITYML